MNAHRSPLGVIVDPDEPTELLCYGRRAGLHMEAIRFGTGELLRMTLARRAAIEADQAKVSKEIEP